MMTNYDSKFEKLRENYEKGIISENDLSLEEMEKLADYYKKEIEGNKREIEETKYKIKQLKKKIDNII